MIVGGVLFSDEIIIKSSKIPAGVFSVINDSSPINKQNIDIRLCSIEMNNGNNKFLCKIPPLFLDILEANPRLEMKLDFVSGQNPIISQTSLSVSFAEDGGLDYFPFGYISYVSSVPMSFWDFSTRSVITVGQQLFNISDMKIECGGRTLDIILDTTIKTMFDFYFKYNSSLSDLENDILKEFDFKSAPSTNKNTYLINPIDFTKLAKKVTISIEEIALIFADVVEKTKFDTSDRMLEVLKDNIVEINDSAITWLKNSSLDLIREYRIKKSGLEDIAKKIYEAIENN